MVWSEQNYESSHLVSTLKRSVIDESQVINLNQMKDLKYPMKIVSDFIWGHDPIEIPLLFQATWQKTIEGQNIVYLSSNDGRIGILNLNTKDINFDSNIQQDPILTFDITKDLKFIYTGGQNGVIRKCNGQELIQIAKLEGHKDKVNKVILSHDGAFLYSASADCAVKMWDLNNLNDCKNLINHESSVEVLDLTSDGNYLLSGGTDCKCYILELIPEVSVWGTIKACGEISALKCSEKKKFVVIGTSLGIIEVWRFGTWEFIKKLRNKDKILCIDISLEEDFIVTGGFDKVVYLWDIKLERNRIQLTGHNGGIRSVFITADQKSLYSLGADSKMMKWKIPKFEDRSLLKPGLTVKEIWFSNINSLLYAYLSREIEDRKYEYSIKAWSMLTRDEVKDFKIIESSIKFYQKSYDDEMFYIIHKVSASYYMSEYNLLTGEKIDEYLLGKSKICSFCVSPKRNYLFIGEILKIKTLLLKNFENGPPSHMIPHTTLDPNGKMFHVFNHQMYHVGEVIKIICTPNEKYIISIDNVNLIKLIDVELMANEDVKNQVKGISHFFKEKMKIIDARLLNGETFIVISTEDVMLWSVQKRSIIKKVANRGFIRINYSLDSNYIFFRTHNKLEIWTTKDFSYNSFIQYEDPIDTFHISPDNKKFAISSNNDIVIYDSPIKMSTIYVSGDGSRKYDFFRYMRKVIDDTSDEYVQGFDDWIIEPFHINSLHLYAFYNYDEHLSKALKDKAPFFTTAHGHSPLSIALKYKYHKCVSVILRELRVRFETNPYIFQSLENCLADLNRSGFDKLHILYKVLLSKTTNSNMPKFSEKKLKSQVILQSSSFLPNKEDFIDFMNFSNEGNSINFLQTFVKLPMLAGTSDSIKFLKGLDSCSNIHIFDTPFIQVFLQEKWNNVKLIPYCQAGVYIAYLTILSLYTVYLEYAGFLYGLLAVNSLFILYELSYIISGKLGYFKDFWNYFDQARILSLFLYIFLIISGFMKHKNWFLALILFFAWMRGIAFFRIYKPTRYLIHLLITACRDIAGFLLIWFYSTVSFSLIFYALMPQQLDYFSYVTGLYNINIGYSNKSGYGGLDSTFYVLVTILNPIIMINLLIAILGDTYKSMKENRVENDARELISLILEAETLMLWRRNQDGMSFLHVCEENLAVVESANVRVKRRLKNLKMRIMKINSTLIEQEVGLVDIGQCLKVRNTDMSKLIEDVENVYKDQ